jgi:hypothetical protein
MGILTTKNPTGSTTTGKQRCWWDLAKAKGYSNSYQCSNASKPGFLFCGTHLRMNRSLPPQYQEPSIDKWINAKASWDKKAKKAKK